VSIQEQGTNGAATVPQHPVAAPRTRDERLAHFSDRPVTAAYDRSQEPDSRKPAGLWVSVEGDGDGWSDWCREESFSLDRLACEHEITLTDDAHILRLDGAEAIDDFTAYYGYSELNVPGSVLSRYVDRIDWVLVAARYQGIIIAPYIWSRRLTDHTFWYYGWDCASGCIWDARTP
jgi:hypothetical protein